MNKSLSNCSKQFNELRFINNLKNILDIHNDSIRQCIEESYPLSSLSNQPFILWAANGGLYHGAFKKNEISGASKFRAYDLVDSDYVINFLTKKEIFGTRDMEMPSIDSGTYLMFLHTKPNIDLNSSDLDILYALFIKSSF